MRTRSIAPGAARWPQLICAPSKAGPVGLEQASRRCRLPSTISALVPTSTSSVSFVAQVRALGQDHAGGIRADVAGDAGQGVDAGARMQRRGRARGAQFEREGLGGERKRCAAELHRIDAEHQVVHDRVADDGHLEDVRHAQLGLARHLGGERVECAAHRIASSARPARVHHRVGHAAHEILAEADLRIHRAAGGDHFARLSDRTGGAAMVVEPTSTARP